jgi:hypothetical protein
MGVFELRSVGGPDSSRVEKVAAGVHTWNPRLPYRAASRRPLGFDWIPTLNQRTL